MRTDAHGQANDLPHTLQRAVPYVAMFLLALLLWLPFGFKTTGLYEEWWVSGRLDSGSFLYFIAPNTEMDSHRVRPLEVFFHALAHDLDPDSFLFYNLLQMLFIFGKMVAVYWLMLEFLPRRRLLGFMTGVLYALYPADTAIFTFRAIHIHAATLAYLLAAYLLIRYWKARRRLGGFALVGTALLLAFSLLQYQVALPMALLTPLALLLFSRRPDRRMLVGAAAWYGTIALVALYAVWAHGQSTTPAYDVGLIDADTGTPGAAQGMLDALVLAYQRQVTGWLRAVGKLDALSNFWPYVVATGIVLAAAGWSLRRRDQEEAPIPRRRFALMLVAGIAIVAIGMAVYLPIPTHRAQEFRIYFLSMLGAALALALVLCLLSRLARVYAQRVFLALALPFVLVGYVHALEQHNGYVNLSLLQQQTLQDIARQAPEVSPFTYFLVIDRVGFFDEQYLFVYGSNLVSALRYLYEEPTLEGFVCRPDGTFSVSGNRCLIDSRGITAISSAENREQVVALPRLLVFDTDDNGSLRLLTATEADELIGIAGYDPRARIVGSAPPARAATMFSCDPAFACYRHATLQPSRVFDLPPDGRIGNGWRFPQPDGAGDIIRWSTNTHSTIDVYLSDETDLQLEFDVPYWLENAVVDSLTLSVNDVSIPLLYELQPGRGRVYQAVIPRSALAGGPARTKLVFTVDRLSPVPNSPTTNLGFMLSKLTVRPR